jgi:type IV secretion system protein VirB6
MKDVQWEVFTYIVEQVETPLITAVSDVMSAFLAYAATPLQVALVLYVALTGLLIIRGYHHEAASTLISRMVAMALVTFVITGAGVYQQYVYDFFFTILPNELGDVVAGAGTTQIVTSNRFDQVWLKAWRAGLEVWRTLSWDDIAEKGVVILFWGVGIVSTVFTFAIWLVSRLLLALYIAVGPLLVALALFPATKAIFERWIGSMISCVILQVVTIVLLNIVLTVEGEVVSTVAAMGSVDPIAMIQVLLAGMIFFGVAAYVALQLPGVATSLAGGLHFHVAALARSGMGAARSGGRRLAASLGRDRDAALAAGRVVYMRIRPSPGGSLSDRGSRAA